jgi:hypothetical protein
MKGYKAFNHDWTYINGFQYEIGKIYEIDENEIQLCTKGFHFCQVPVDTLQFYNKQNCKYAEICAYGKILEDNLKCVCSKIEIIKELSLEEIEKLTTGLFIRENGTKEWYLDGKLHRLDGPAIEHANGSKFWYFEGRLDRSDGPAVEHYDGSKYWYFEGELHCPNGPAIDLSDGKYWYQEWWLEGQFIRKDFIFFK